MDANSEMIAGSLIGLCAIAIIYMVIDTVLKSKAEKWEQTHDE